MHVDVPVACKPEIDRERESCVRDRDELDGGVAWQVPLCAVWG